MSFLASLTGISRNVEYTREGSLIPLKTLLLSNSPVLRVPRISKQRSSQLITELI
jgi:hypothetical protein